MYKIKVLSSFSAAHFLREYKGKCEALHGHNWKVEVMVASSELDNLGMVIDFGAIKKIVNERLKSFDHVLINDIEYFRKVNPTSENMAKYLFDQIKEDLSQLKCNVSEVRIWETDTSCAVFSESN
tara:strand:+ start:561 stop:935 length:375 start_codon:yes stop_codon:yes gene_type:complete